MLAAERTSTGDGWRGLTYGEAERAALSVGQGLLDLGLGPDRPLLVLYADDRAEIVAAFRRHGVKTWARTDTSLHFRDCCGNVLVATVP